ncbi:protein arginine N-methyltransferase 9 isoform X2 [Anabrus simplex]
MFTCYEQAIDVFGDNEEVLNNLGAHLFRMGHLNEACNFFHQALEANYCFLPAHRNLESISNLLVERWHFRMLNDSLRNLAYREAIIKKVKQGFDTVLDIGTGTGILSLFAVEGGAKYVYACDNSPTMINIANEVMEANDASMRVRLLNKLSNDLIIPLDIPHRVSLVVTETLDAGLLGENILQTLVHAWSSLLLPPHMSADTDFSQNKQKGIVIPFGATIWVAPIQCYDIARKCTLVRENQQVCHPNGSSRMTSEIRPEGNNENEENLEFYKVNLVALEDEPYDTQDLNKVRGGFRFLSPAREAMHINFNNCVEMAKYLSGDREGCQFIVKCTESGHIDAMAAWFDLQLDEDLTLSSTPEETENKAECWDQTIFPLQDPIDVTQGQNLLVKVTCIGGKLAVRVNTVHMDSQSSDRKVGKTIHTSKSGPVEVQHQNNTTGSDESPVPISKCIENLANLDLQHLDSTCLQSSGDNNHSSRHCLPVSEEIVMFLNDHSWVAALIKTANELLCASDIGSKSWNILDLSPFPVLGLTLLKGLTKLETSTTKWDQVTCVVREDKDEAAVRYVAEANDIDNAHIECIKEEQFEDSLDSKSHFDVILVQLVNSRGELKESYVNYLPSLRKLLKKNGHFLPRQLSMHCAVVKSKWLAEVSRVIDRDRVCGYKIAEFINAYQVSEHLDFWLDSIVNDIYNSTEVLNISIESFAITVESPLTVKMKIPIEQSGSANAIVYWFKMQLLGVETEVTTGQLNSYANYSAILINPDCRLTAGESVELILTCHQGLIHAGLQQNEE